MRFSLLGASLGASVAAAQPWMGRADDATSAGPDVDGKYTIEGTGIRATFVPYGASVSNLFICKCALAATIALVALVGVEIDSSARRPWLVKS